MRVAFTVFIDADWTGGLHYLRNLFSALADVPGRPVVPVLFVAPETPREAWLPLRPHLAEDPVVVAAWQGGRSQRLRSTLLSGHDKAAAAAFRAADIDVVFNNDAWYGFRFPMAMLVWIADFQHCRLPQMFTPLQRAKRWAKFNAYCLSASRLMVSSEDGKRDCEHFFQRSRGRVEAVPFAVQLGEGVLDADAQGIAAQHGLPQKFFYLPAQMWKHKNHAVLVEALGLLKAAGTPVVVAASGNAKDARHPDHPQQVLQRVAQHGLQDSFRFLGHVPYAHIMPLMRASAAVLNPSRFEGWSTTVEEAKALGVPLLLSNLPVHREQAPAGTRFFEPTSAADIAAVLAEAWSTLAPGPRPVQERDAIAAYQLKRAAFAQRFISVARQAMAEHLRR